MRRAIRLAGPSARGSTPRVTASGPAVRAGADVSRLVATQDLELAATIEANDAQMDALHRQSFQMILDPANELSRQQVIDAVLMGRFLERFGDHSTSVARRMTYLVSGTTAPVVRDDGGAR